MGNLGMPELMMIMVLALLLFGPKKLPEIGKQVGKALGEFKRASNDLKRSIEDEMDKATKAGLDSISSDPKAEPKPEPPALAPAAGAVAQQKTADPATTPIDADDAVVTEEAPRREDAEEELPRMSFLEHLEDLRKRLFVSAARDRGRLPPVLVEGEGDLPVAREARPRGPAARDEARLHAAHRALHALHQHRPPRRACSWRAR